MRRRLLCPMINAKLLIHEAVDRLEGPPPRPEKVPYGLRGGSDQAAVSVLDEVRPIAVVLALADAREF